MVGLYMMYGKLFNVFFFLGGELKWQEKNRSILDLSWINDKCKE